jgi:hypothetical protein
MDKGTTAGNCAVAPLAGLTPLRRAAKSERSADDAEKASLSQNTQGWIQAPCRKLQGG